jgi:predicted nucleic acid-binding protein
MAGLTLDSGALIAADRNDRRFWVLWKEALRRGADVTVPAPVVAQAWRGNRNARMAQLLAACVVEPLSESDARDAGELCGRVKTSDAIDACVVVSAAARGDAVVTSDVHDITYLVQAARSGATILSV